MRRQSSNLDGGHNHGVDWGKDGHPAEGVVHVGENAGLWCRAQGGGGEDQSQPPLRRGEFVSPRSVFLSVAGKDSFLKCHTVGESWRACVRGGGGDAKRAVMYGYDGEGRFPRKA